MACIVIAGAEDLVEFLDYDHAEGAAVGGSRFGTDWLSMKLISCVDLVDTFSIVLLDYQQMKIKKRESIALIEATFGPSNIPKMKSSSLPFLGDFADAHLKWQVVVDLLTMTFPARVECLFYFVYSFVEVPQPKPIH